MPQEFYTDGTPSRTEIDDADGQLTRFADDATIAQLERQARRIAELEAALSAAAKHVKVTRQTLWYHVQKDPKLMALLTRRKR